MVSFVTYITFICNLEFKVVILNVTYR